MPSVIIDYTAAQIHKITVDEACVKRNIAISFSCVPSGDIVSYDWDFGDGGSSTLQNPIYSYSVVGDFTIRLTVTDGDGGTFTPLHPELLHIDEATVLPVPDFTNNLSLGGQETTFTDASTNASAASWVWEDGTLTIGKVVMKSLSAGQRLIRHWGINSLGLVEMSRIIKVYIMPTISLTASKYACTVGETITFTNTSTNTGDVGVWLAANSDGLLVCTNPLPSWTHTFTRPANFAVLLSAFTGDSLQNLGEELNGGNVLVVVSSALSTEIIPSKFTAIKGRGIVFNQKVLKDDVPSIPDSVLWNFGDGIEFNGLSATHKYGKAGVYTVSATTNMAGVEAVTSTMQVRILPVGLPKPTAVETISKKRPDAFAKASAKARERFAKARRGE